MKSIPKKPENLREELIRAALEILNEPDTKLNMRELGRRVGRTQTAAYTAFGKKKKDREKDRGGNRTALLAAVAAHGFEQLAGRLADGAAETHDNPVAVLEAYGHAYLEFAHEQPRLYRLMFGDALKDILGFEDLVGTREDLVKARFNVQEILQKAILDARDAGLVSGRTDLDHALNAWATLHGLAELHLDRQLDLVFDFDPDEIQRFVYDSVHNLVASMKERS